MSEVRGGGNGSLLRRSRIACVLLLFLLLLSGSGTSPLMTMDQSKRGRLRESASKARNRGFSSSLSNHGGNCLLSNREETGETRLSNCN